MGQLLHGSARTTEAVRRAIQLRQEGVRAAARRFGVSPTTVQKWRRALDHVRRQDGAEGRPLDRAHA
jgi:transposase-like protein